MLVVVNNHDNLCADIINIFPSYHILQQNNYFGKMKRHVISIGWFHHFSDTTLVMFDIINACRLALINTK